MKDTDSSVIVLILNSWPLSMAQGPVYFLLLQQYRVFKVIQNIFPVNIIEKWTCFLLKISSISCQFPKRIFHTCSLIIILIPINHVNNQWVIYFIFYWKIFILFWSRLSMDLSILLVHLRKPQGLKLALINEISLIDKTKSIKDCCSIIFLKDKIWSFLKPS